MKIPQILFLPPLRLPTLLVDFALYRWWRNFWHILLGCIMMPPQGKPLYHLLGIGILKQHQLFAWGQGSGMHGQIRTENIGGTKFPNTWRTPPFLVTKHMFLIYSLPIRVNNNNASHSHICCSVFSEEQTATLADLWFQWKHKKQDYRGVVYQWSKASIFCKEDWKEDDWESFQFKEYSFIFLCHYQIVLRCVPLILFESNCLRVTSRQDSNVQHHYELKLQVQSGLTLINLHCCNTFSAHSKNSDRKLETIRLVVPNAVPVGTMEPAKAFLCPPRLREPREGCQRFVQCKCLFETKRG